MDPKETGTDKLINGIQNDAHKEAEKILAQARQDIEARISAGDIQAKAIINNAEKRMLEQSVFIKERMAGNIAVETQRISLRVKKELINNIISIVKTDIQSLIKSSDYRQILIAWIVEAAIGLNAEEAEVNASVKEIPFLDEKTLTSAETAVKNLTGQTVKLMLSDKDPLPLQGIVLTAADGKTAFNNQVHTRFLRYKSQIQRIIYKELYSEQVKYE